MLIIEKCLRYQTPLALNFIIFERVFNSVDRRVLAKVLFLYGIPGKYIKVISTMYKNNTASINIGNEVSSWFCIQSGVKQGFVPFSFIWIILMDLVLRSIGRAMGEHGITW